MRNRDTAYSIGRASDLADSDVAELNDLGVALQTDEAGRDEVRRQARLAHHRLAVQQHADKVVVRGDLERVPVPLCESWAHGLGSPAGRGRDPVNGAGLVQAAAVD